MYSFFNKLIKRKILIPVFFIVLAAVGVLLLPLVNINYDMTEYLPQHAGTKQAIDVAQKEFDYPGTAQVMAKDISIADAVGLKQKLAEIQGVKSVLWLDDVTDITKPLAFIPQATKDEYYKDNCALFHVEFTKGNYDTATSDALVKIRALGSNVLTAGPAENSRNMKGTMSGEMFNVIAYVVPICLLILMIASYSWLEPLLYLFVIGISIAINMGANALMPNISFITNSMGAVLQLAISMDYSIFLMHRYFEERDNGLGVKEAIVKACVESLASVSASALTTVAGFAALLLMQYRVGADIGLVLAKGIVISFVTVMLLMPVMIALFSKVLEKTRHKLLLPSFGKIGKGVVKLRYVFIVLAVLLIVPCALAQNKNHYLYGDSSATEGAGQVAAERKEITGIFGIQNPVMALVPAGDTQKEILLAGELKSLSCVKSVTSLVTIMDNTIASSFLPQSVVDSFRSEHYERVIINLNIEGENQAVFDAVKDLRATLQKYYPDTWYAAGTATSLADIKDTVVKDGGWVTIISLIAVGLIVLISLRSLSVPVLLLAVIQGAIWINMAVPYFSGYSMAYIGYLIVSSLQLGSTIDYGILLSNRYLEFRSGMNKKEAAVAAVKAAGPSVLLSALMLMTAGFAFGLISKMASISEFGMLIGRGALVSCVLTIVLLPSLLVLLDKYVAKLSLKRKGDRIDEKENNRVGAEHHDTGALYDADGGRAIGRRRSVSRAKNKQG
jgi:predicted RND superfamily exporter protein